MLIYLKLHSKSPMNVTIDVTPNKNNVITINSYTNILRALRLVIQNWLLKSAQLEHLGNADLTTIRPSFRVTGMEKWQYPVFKVILLCQTSGADLIPNRIPFHRYPLKGVLKLVKNLELSSKATFQKPFL